MFESSVFDSKDIKEVVFDVQCLQVSTPEQIFIVFLIKIWALNLTWIRDFLTRTILSNETKLQISLINMILKWILIFFIQFILQLTNRVHIKCNKVVLPVACENIRFSSLFAAGDASRNVPSDEERGETDVFAGYATSPNCSNAG